MSAVTATALGIGAAASQVDASDAGAADSYFVDQLFRTETPPVDAAATGEGTREATPIFTRAVLGQGAETDRTYLAQLVSRRTGLAQPEAEQRVDQVIAETKEAADTARQASATASIMQALAWLVGAFIGAVAGGLGGRHRDLLSEAG
jgi:hypothetical protein